MTSTEILKMIESVDPSDTSTLNEIDRLVWEWLTGKTAHGYFKEGWFEHLANGTRRKVPEYTRSRDALKAIRPEGWRLYVNQSADFKSNGSRLWSAALEYDKPNLTHRSKYHATEELAELHAIIQAIDYNRKERP